MGCSLRGNTRKHDDCRIEGSRKGHTHFKQESELRSSGDPELIAIEQGLVRAGERQTPIR